MAKGTNDLADALSPLLEARGLDLIDVELHGSELTVFVDRQGGVDLDTLGEATRAVSAALDEIDPLPGRYTLAVSSPDYCPGRTVVPALWSFSTSGGTLSVANSLRGKAFPTCGGALSPFGTFSID